MVAEWFCQVMGSEVGPLSQRQLVDMVRQHQVNPEDLVRRNGSSWVPAFEVKGLFEAASKPPARTDPAVNPSKPTVQADPSNPALSPLAKENSDRRREVPKTENARSHSPLKTEADGRGSIEKRMRVDSIPTNDQTEDWFCIASGEKCGPLGFDELKAMSEDGRLRDRDRVWRASWPKFQKAGEIDGLTAPG